MTRTELTGRSVTIVGAGFGGLSAACHLADRGADVTVLERHSVPGGSAGRIEADGFRFDTGPSWYLMPEVFERFFDRFDRSPGEYYDLIRLDPNYRVFWKDGDRADVPADPSKAAKLFATYEPGADEALGAYLDQAAEAYEVGMERFVYEDRSRFRDMLDLDVARSGRGISLLGTMDEHVADYFHHPKLRQLVQYTLVFLGGAPHNTPALYTLMSHVDFNLGVYYPMGGIASVVDRMADLANELGVTIETGVDVVAIDPMTGVDVVAGDPTMGVDEPGFRLTVDQDGDRTVRSADLVVSNAPPPYVERELLSRQPRRRRSLRLRSGGDDAGWPGAVRPTLTPYWKGRTYAPSAYMLYLGIEGDVSPLAHHTLVLPVDWEAHFESIFEDPRWPEDPSYYVSVPSRTDETVAPAGCETIVVLVPIAPGLEDDPATRSAFRDRLLADIAANTGVDLRDRIVYESEACVSEFADRLNAPRGTALGLAHTLGQTGPLRPSFRAPGIENLYYVGSYVNPGIGMPMCLLSGEHVTNTIIDDLVRD